VPLAVVGERRVAAVVEVERVVVAQADVQQPAARIRVFLGHLAQDRRARRLQVGERGRAEVARDHVLGLDDLAADALEPDPDQRRLAVDFHHRHQPDLLRDRVGHVDLERRRPAVAVRHSPSPRRSSWRSRP
jgi:hypothetical protein